MIVMDVYQLVGNHNKSQIQDLCLNYKPHAKTITTYHSPPDTTPRHPSAQIHSNQRRNGRGSRVRYIRQNGVACSSYSPLCQWMGSIHSPPRVSVAPQARTVARLPSCCWTKRCLVIRRNGNSQLTRGLSRSIATTRCPGCKSCQRGLAGWSASASVPVDLACRSFIDTAQTIDYPTLGWLLGLGVLIS